MAWGSYFCYPKTQEKLEIMYQNVIYICISSYNKICWFPVKKYWCQGNSGVCQKICDFIHRLCVTDFREFFASPPIICEQPRKCLSWIRLSLNFCPIFFYKKCFYKKMSVKNPKTLRNIYKISSLKFLSWNF